jgi:membrane-associated HD superfamily phosphohydrolase
MPYKDKEKAKEHSRKYYEEHKEEKRAYSRDYYQNHIDKMREYFRMYSQVRSSANPEEAKERKKVWYENNKERWSGYKKTYKNKDKERAKNASRKHQIKRLYGMTLEDYEVLFNKQGGVCAICGKPETTRRLSIDHNHETGMVRGLLCSRCNLTIGKMEDNIELFELAITYLKGE